MSELQLTKQHETQSITNLANLYQAGMLQLSPAFQRQSVWTLKDRQKLIDTVVRNYPLPAIFLYKNQDDGKVTYSVIDGKQRLETLLGFLGYLRGGRFEVRLDVPGFEGVQRVSAQTLKSNKLHREKLSPHFMTYRIPVIEVAGPLSDIVEVFVRINSTGKPLTPQEKRKAKYSGSGLLVEATRLAGRLEQFWVEQGVVSAQQIARMKHVELAAELIVSIDTGDVINKKAAVDKMMSSSSVTAARMRKASDKVFKANNFIRRMFPDIRATRLRQIVDFYSLVVLVAKLNQEGAILSDRKRNRLASDLLKAFSVEVDAIRLAQRKLLATRPENQVYRDYLLTVSQMTDDVSQRRRREQILRSILEPLFAKKDGQRGFTPEQRRILWNSTGEKRCKSCNERLSWDNFTIDHISPHTKGGRSELDNAALMCRSCNSSKGSRKALPKVVARL